MSRVAVFFLLVIAPIMALLLAWLGIMTLSTNPTGWFLLLVGVVYIAGLFIFYAIYRQRFWEAVSVGGTTHEERGDRSFWFVTLGMIAVFYLSPSEYLYLPAVLPRSAWMAYGGVGLVILGTALFVWARRALRRGFSGHLSTTSDQTLVQSGPYRLIRHPAYAGYLWMASGISLGYASLVGLASILILLLPGLVYRMIVEEKLLAEHFGEAYCRYASQTKRLIPGIW